MNRKKIIDFLEELKSDCLKQKVNQSDSEQKRNKIKEGCDDFYDLNNWIPYASKNIKYTDRATHPCTFSHPSSRKNKNGDVIPIIFFGERKNDGYLRSGNGGNFEIDTLNNAAYNYNNHFTYKFLDLKMEDGLSLIEHISMQSEFSKSLLNIPNNNYDELRQNFLTSTVKKIERITGHRIKQVYFPVKEGYHLLSILTNSGMMYGLKARLDKLRFSDEIKELREKKKNNEFSNESFKEVYNLTRTTYGEKKGLRDSAKKQLNISALAKLNNGEMDLLNSMPPVLKKREIHFPKSNFFQNTMKIWETSEIFDALYRLYSTDYNNIDIRNGRIYRYEQLMDKIVEKMWAVRLVSSEQYYEKNSKLKSHQKIWLSHEHEEERENDDAWLDKLEKEISRWIVTSYEKRVNKKGFKLGTEELKDIAKVVHEHREALR